MTNHGLFPTRNTMMLKSAAQTRSISAENPDGSVAGGARALEGTGAQSARDLGLGFKVAPSIVIPAGTTATLADIDGEGAIQSMWMTGGLGKHLILRMYWDGQDTPSVECPVPDFFAHGWLRNHPLMFDLTTPFSPIQSEMVAVNPNWGLNCFWPMPFRKKARITMENRATEDKTLYFQINYALDQVPAEALYFHAQYRQTRPLTPKDEYVILDNVRGSGQFVGTALSVGLNGSGGWWGEGEIKFFLDGDDNFPTICGTGTEDYFGGAYNWDVRGKYTPYTGPYMGMNYWAPDGTYNSQARFSLYRWHVVDPIRFERDLRVTIQDLGWMSGGRYLPRRDDFMSVAFWYQDAPATAFPPLPDADELEVQ